MRQLADYVLDAGDGEFPVSPPVRGDLRPSSSPGKRARYVTLGFAAQDVGAARGMVGHEARLVCRIGDPHRDLGRLRVIEVNPAMALLIAEVLPGTAEEAIAPSSAVAAPPGTAAIHA
jgi:hypothetical protein